jgi:ferric-dicitrate binding protein FerR (iron transport regulator)
MPGKDPKEEILLLLSNKDFKDWVLDPSGDRDLYWTNWMKSNPDKIQAVHKAREIVRQMKFREEFLSEQEMELLLGNIISHKISDEGGKLLGFKRARNFRWLKVAASFLVVLSFVFTYRYWSAPEAPIALKKVENLKGQRTRITLPDESVVYLNASSTLTFPENFAESERTVELTGEAFFEVVKNPARPFIVKTNHIRTVVLGTSFNVRAFDIDGSINVSLVTGKVRVVGEHSSTHNHERVLLPGEQLTYLKADSSFVKGNFKVLDVTGWKDGVLVFDNTNFTGFIEKLEQWYGVNISVTGKPSVEWHVNGHFDNESLEEVLVGIQFVYDIDYHIANNSVTLKCK